MKKKFLNENLLCGRLQKFLLFMSLKVFVLISSFTLSYGITLSQAKLDVEFRNENFEDVIKYLQKNSDYEFIYKKELLEGLKVNNLSMKNASLLEILNELLATTSLEYVIMEDVVVIREKENTLIPQKSYKIRGNITDQNDVPLPGVTIRVEGTSFGTATDTDGNFSFDYTEASGKLILSFIGFKQMVVNFKDGDSLKIKMEEDIAEFEEVVVTGIFERKVDSYTGSIASYKRDDLKMIGSGNVLQSLKTLDPSFHITPNNEYGSDPNQLPDIDIRGKSSVLDPRTEYEADPNQPLFILDGFEVGLQSVVDLSMDRIESVTILKDAASAAIYGSRAANGVVVIETIKPQAGSLRINYGGVFDLSMPDLSDYNLMNAKEKLEFERLAGVYDSPSAASTQYRYRELYNKRLANVQSGVDTYWLSEPVRTGFTNKHNLYIEGGDEAMVYGLGINYAKTQGVMKKSGNDVLSFNIDFQYRKNTLRFYNKFSLDQNKSWNPPVSFSKYASANPYHVKDKKNITEYLEYYVIAIGTTIDEENPLYNASLNYLNDGNKLGFRNNLYVDWRPIDGLITRGRFSLEKTIGKTVNFKSPYHTDFNETARTERGNYTKATSEIFKYSGDATITYGKLFNNIHQINLVGSWEFSSTKTINDSYTVVGFSDDKVPNPAFSNSYKDNSKASYDEYERRSTSFFINGNYALNSRYLFDFNYRYDGSSNFGADKLFTTTWSAGIAWNLHNEKFMGNWSNLLKLRFSVGNPGNNNTNYNTEVTYIYNTLRQNVFGNGVIVNNFGNVSLDWEKTMNYTLGIDFALFNNRIRFSGDVYKKVSDPLVVNISLPPSTGQSSLLTNMGKNTIKGLDFNFTILPINNIDRGLIWSVTVNGSSKKAEYSGIMDALESLNDELKENLSYKRYRDGGSAADIWLVRSAGIDPMTGDEVYIKANGEYTFDYSAQDEVIVGNTEPSLEGRVITNIRYKGFILNMAFHYIFGADEVNRELYSRIENMSRVNLLKNNQDKRAFYDRWSEVGQVAKYRRMNDFTEGRISSRYVQKKNWFAGESISLSYEFYGQEWLRNIRLKNLTLRLNMNDLFKWSTIKQERGISYPFARTVSLSINATF